MMERNLRSNRNQPIIEISESDDEDSKVFSKVKDDDYTIEQNATKTKVKKNKETVKNRKQKNTQIKNVKSTKRKSQEESLEPRFNNKKPKLEESSVSDSKPFQHNQKNVIKTDTKHDAKIKKNSSFSQSVEWTDVDYISEIHNVDRHIAENIVKLFKEDNTIPFIARYRKNMTGSMEPDQLRALKDSFEQVKIIKHRAANIIKNIDKLEKWSPEIHSIVTSSKSLADLEHIYSLYKPSSKRTLAERARELGLGSISNAVLQGQRIPPLVSLINKEKKGLQNEEEVRDGIVHIIADIISKDKEVFDKVMFLRKMYNVDIQTTQCSASENSKNENEQKYKGYFSFKSNERSIKPHQTLAINRAELQKIINVKIIVPDAFERAFKIYCLSRYTHRQKSGENSSRLHEDLLRTSVDYAYKKLIKPLVVRRVRSEMKERAEAASIEVFATNVKQLLLTPPVRGKVVLGIDPGFYHGCKLAVVSEHGDVLETAVIKPNTQQSGAFQQSAETLQKLMKKHNCTVVSLGNGTASRETEMFLTRMIQSKMFGSLDIKYTIVDEAGASIYSCGSEAKSEFPDLDPNLISAVSIARRLQDPLAELVKVEPKHLGVGQYQHDLPEKQLLNALDEVVTEAVSFVGVDINTASHCLLRRVAGLTNSRAASIIEWRAKHGAFKNRQQLLDIKGIGNKTFEQCAGFIRILPETAKIASEEFPEKRGKTSKNNDLNPLDQTWIHPESYIIASDFVLNHCKCKLDDLGTPAFIEKINFHAKTGCAALAAQFNTNEATMEVIIKALAMKKNEDIRLASNYHLFRDGMRSISDLSVGTVLSGVVRNVTHFGAFVDVGVGDQGLIHVTRMKKQTLQVSQRVEVKVIEVDVTRKRISLELITTL